MTRALAQTITIRKKKIPTLAGAAIFQFGFFLSAS
jgi:hypothetical protein